MNKKIIKEYDGYWYYDEDQEDYEGPFDSYDKAEIAFNAHIKWSTREHRHSIRKMKRVEEGV